MQTCCPTDLPTNAQPSPQSLAQFLNDECLCNTLDSQSLGERLGQSDNVLSDLPNTHPHMFAPTPVFISQAQLSTMQAGVHAIERVVRAPAYQQLALAETGSIAHHDFGPIGGLLGYDFHLTEIGAKLIEINTNAGGAFLSNALYEAQVKCCGVLPGQIVGAPIGQFPEVFSTLMNSEWRHQRGAEALRTIAIVDDNPTAQYLHPEFLLAQNALQDAGYKVMIVDGAELVFEGDRLTSRGIPIDLVYNRLVDFDLSETRHTALRDAYLAGAVVVSPNPRNHALVADKRNLCTLSSTSALEAIGVPSTDRKAILSIVPESHSLAAQDGAQAWQDRKNWFFKPVAGHGSKAVYRGDKLTKRVWQNLLQQDYVMQMNVPPSQRIVAYHEQLDKQSNKQSALGNEAKLRAIRHKTDIRLYTYDAKVIMAVARLYQGQTTNLRTPLGGFAPVYLI